jgi:hypothetical protein
MRTFLLALLSSTALASIINCNTNSVFTVNALEFYPDPAIRNENSTITFDFTVPAEVTQGTAKYSFSFNGIPFTPTVNDLCLDTTCPVVVGHHSQSTSSPFPDVSGKVITKIEWFDELENSLLCAQITTKVS